MNLLKHLPTDTGLSFVLVQHLDPDHESALTHLLRRATTMPVHEVTNDLQVERNHVYVIPPNRNMTIEQGRLHLQPRPPTTGGLRSIDCFFESLAHDQGERAIGVILSGTASDGTAGMEAIKAEGGITFAQDESAKYDSMPRSAMASGCVDCVLSPQKMALELARMACHPYLTAEQRPMAAAVADAAEPAPPGAAEPSPGREAPRVGEDDGFHAILFLLRNHTGVDFSLYKPNTIRRRIARRMVLSKFTALDGYAHFLRSNPAELDQLYADLLIGVTGFFRNPDAFEMLKRRVFHSLLSEGRESAVRFWVPACSTGQEAYSLAMAFVECTDHIPRPPKLQIFATDLSGKLLETARAGLYAKGLVADLPPERLRRFFTEEDDSYRIRKSLRETIVFAKHNLLSDPPFSRMDLITCRNLLIYLDAGCQQKAMIAFHYALKPTGYLFLGASESIGSFTNLFEPMDKKTKLYRKKPGRTPALGRHLGPPRPPVETQALRAAKSASALERFPPEIVAQREADRVTLSRFAPVGVLVNAQLQVVQFRGDTSPYLKPPTGQATFNVLEMARDGLRVSLRATLNQAKKDNAVVRKEQVRVDPKGQRRLVDLEVVPLSNLAERSYLIFFEEPSGVGDAGTPAAPRTGRPSSRPSAKAEVRRIAELERDLAETGDYLQSVLAQYQEANEELQASNEEVTSANEELQSVNEELETSKEELESSNEELTTINEEMAHRNTELQRLTEDLINLQSSTRLAIVLLGRDLTIRRFTPQAEHQFNLRATDLGRPISNVRHNLDLTDLEPFVTDVIETACEREREVRDREGRWYCLHVRPYLTLDNKVDGAVLVLVDIDILKRTQQAVTDAREQAEAIIRTVPEPLVVLNAEMGVHAANDAFYRTFQLSFSETHGRVIFDLGKGSWDIPELRRLLEDMLARNSFFNDVEITHVFERIGRRTMLFNARVLNDPSDKPKKILMGIRDITEVLTFQSEMRWSELRYRRLFEAAHDGVLILNPATRAILDANPFILDLLGYSREEVIGKELFEIGLLKDRGIYDAAFQQLETQGYIQYQDVPVETRTGERRVVELVSNLYREDGERIIQCTILDVTERRRAQANP